MTAFNHRDAQRKKPGRIARARRVSYGYRPANWGPRRADGRKPVKA